MFIFDLIIWILTGWLWYRGGKRNSKYMRKFIIASILSTYISIKLHSLLSFFLVGITFQTSGIGYGNYDPINDSKPSFLASWLKDKSEEWIRLVWGIIVSSCISLTLRIINFLSNPSVLCYIVINSIVNFLVSKLKLNVKLTDWLIGLSIGSIVFFVKRKIQ